MNKLDYKKVFETLVNKTKEYLLNNNLKAMILGISGGIDSTVTAAICHEVSKQTGIPLIGRSLPIRNKEDEFDTSKLVGEAFCNDFKVVKLYREYRDLLHEIVWQEEGLDMGAASLEVSKKQTPIANGNIQARLRMIYLYNLASIHKGIVFSTDNQTEYQLGFWTLHGDVGDFNPLFGLWKTEVYELAQWIFYRYDTEARSKGAYLSPTAHYYVRKLDAIKSSMALTPTDGLGISNSDLDQIGAKSYKEVDDILQTMLLYENPEQEKWDILCFKYGYEVVNKVWSRHLASEFKRKQLPITINREEYQ